MSTMTIAKLARAGGVGVETVRYYQRRALLREPPRSPGGGISGGIRRYDAADLRRLRFIRAAQTAGFTLDEIGALLQFDATDDRARAHHLAQGRLRALDQKIAELQTARAALKRLAQACCETTAGPCPILTAFDEA